MPRLRAINFENFTTDEALRVCKDILMKYPRGPLQRQKKEDYRPGRYSWEDVTLLSEIDEEDEFSQSHSLRARRWGYTDEQAYKTVMAVFGGNRPSEWDVRNRLWQMHPEWSQHKATRSAKRFWNRLGPACDAFIKTMNVEKMFVFRAQTPAAWISEEDARKSYRMRARKENYQFMTRVSVTANTEPEAKVMAEAMFGHAAVQMVCTERVDWIACNEGNAVERNTSELQRIAKEKEALAEQMEAIKNKMAEMELLEEAIQMYNITIFADN